MLRLDVIDYSVKKLAKLAHTEKHVELRVPGHLTPEEKETLVVMSQEETMRNQPFHRAAAAIVS